jgi:nitroimidazol reductase NimA-like FMN-containing flavoprotein (pyridoxamine 5'-phosphate oxidase superfamily)
MAADTATAMDALAIADFLDEQSTGVLSMADDDVGYGAPVAFAYDEADQDLYVRLDCSVDGQHRRFIDAAEAATLVVHGRTDDRWTHVAAVGYLEELGEDGADAAVAQAVHGVELPPVAGRVRPADASRTLLRLDVTELSGTVER